MERTAATRRAARKNSSRGRSGIEDRNGEALQSAPLVFQHPKTRLEAAIQRYVDLFDFAPIGYVTFNRSGRMEEVNLAATQLLNRSRENLIGRLFGVLVAREDSQVFLKHLDRCRSSETPIETELSLRCTDGTLVPVQLSSTPLLSLMKDGARLYQTAIIDLTERKKAEDALRRSQARYHTLFDFVPVAVYTCDADGLIVEFNHRAKELWGRKPKTNDLRERFCGSFKIFYPDGKVMPHKKCPMARVLRGEECDASDLEIIVEREDGERRSVSVKPIALRNERGKIIGAINCLFDVTESKRAEEALRESEELHRALVNQTAVGMARSDLNGRFTFVNKKFCELLGYKKESELVGKRLLDITHPVDIAHSRKLFRRLIDKGVSYHLEKRYIRKDGSIIWVNVSASPMRDADGKTRAGIAVIRDISERKKAQAKLENAKVMLETRVQERTAELLAANEELKNEIVRRKRLEGEILEVSEREQSRIGQDLHDSLCQHLTAVAFMARVVARRLKDHRVVEVADLERIAHLINDGVTEARTIARGLHPVEMDSAGLTAALQSLLHRQSTLPYRLDVDEEISISDPTIALQLYRIAREAVINANKHSGAREVLVRMRRSDKKIELSVTDDGIGIDRNRGEGKGMGFHIMDYRARSIGARLEIESIKPHGTCVACYVPQK